MAQVAWTAEAQLWLRDIYDYIAADNPAAAERVVLAICDTVAVGTRSSALARRSARAYVGPAFLRGRLIP